MRQGWSDDRLDGLSERVDEGFARMDRQFERMDQRFNQVEGLIKWRSDENEHRFNRLEAIGTELRAEANSHHEQAQSRIDRLQLSLIVTCGGLLGTLIVTCGTVIGIAVT